MNPCQTVVVCMLVRLPEDYNHQKCAQQLIISSLPVNGLATQGVLPPFALGLGSLPPSAYGGGIPGLGAFALTQAGAMNNTAQAALRGISNVLLVSNLNEEVNIKFWFLISTLNPFPVCRLENSLFAVSPEFNSLFAFDLIFLICIVYETPSFDVSFTLFTRY